MEMLSHGTENKISGADIDPPAAGPAGRQDASFEQRRDTNKYISGRIQPLYNPSTGLNNIINNSINYIFLTISMLRDPRCSAPRKKTEAGTAQTKLPRRHVAAEPAAAAPHKPKPPHVCQKRETRASRRDVVCWRQRLRPW
jgi:hypothetical protein